MDKKIIESYKLLEQALQALKKHPKDKLAFASASKSFEVCFEYVWKYFKRSADRAGLETYSPRDSIKAAAQLGLIKDPEVWNNFLNARNLSVHDYIGISDESFLPLMHSMAREVKNLLDDNS